MKLIENTVYAENLEISHGDLDDKMASCGIVKVNGQSSEKKTSAEKSAIEKTSNTSKLPNGTHEKVDGQSKCNGSMNGFCEEVSDEEFQLVLESSSDDGGSPLKKMDEDTISAPQIVQEIEDLLGINSSSVGIDDEIEELNGAESTEHSDKYDDGSVNSESGNIPQEIKDVFEDQGDIPVKLEGNSSVKDKKRGGKDVTNKRSGEAAECDSSSNMNLVFDEIEIGTLDSVDSQDEETTAVEKSIEESKDSSKTPEVDGPQSNEVESTTENRIEDEKSENQDAEETERNQEKETKADIETAIETIELVNSSTLDMEKEDVPSTNVTNSCERATDGENLVEMSHDDEKCEIVETPATSYDILDCKSDSLCVELADDVDVDLNIQPESIKAVASSTSHSEVEAVRKRTSPVDEEEAELKKPKLENNAEENLSKALKRRSSDPVESGTKRPKLGDCVLVTEPLVDSSEEETIVGESSGIKQDAERDCLDGGAEVSETKVEEENIDDDSSTCKKVLKSKSDEDSVISTTQIAEQPEGITDCKSEKKEMQSDEIDSTPAKLAVSSDNSNLPKEKLFSSLNEVSTSEKDIDGPHSIQRLTSEDIAEEVGSVTERLEVKDKNISENKENIVTSSSVSTSNSKNKANIQLDSGNENLNEGKDKSSLKTENQSKSISNLVPSTDVVKKTDLSKIHSKPGLDKTEKPKQDNATPSSSRETKNFVKKSEQSKTTAKSPFDLLTKNMQETKPPVKKMSNLESCIDRVAVGKKFSNTERVLPLLKKFHKDQLKKLTRSELEEVVVLKICEAVTDRSEIGQMRLRCQALEQNNELWRKKAAQFEKQNRELEMVLKRFLTEASQNKKDKFVMPIKVTRSVGLQVVLASSMHGSLVTSRSRHDASSAAQSSSGRSQPQPPPPPPPQPQPQLQGMARPKPVEREHVKASTFTPPVQAASQNRRGRPAKCFQNQSQASNPLAPSPQPSPSKVSPPPTPSKQIAPKPAIPSKDMEVIDLTDKEEKTKAPSQTPVGGSIRVAPATQMCFVQQNPTNSPPQQMAYFVQKAGQRPQQYLVTTTSASPSKGGGTITQRPTPALAVPVFRSGQIIPVQTSAQGAVRATTNTVSPATRQLPQAIRLPSQVVLKHPAPLPSAPIMQSKPGWKSPPPRPQLKIAKTVNGIMLSWSMILNKDTAEMASYQLYAYQEGNQTPTTSLWKKVGDVKALPLPMACTLTQFIDGHKYHFAVRAVDVHGRIGPYSLPSTILLTK